MRAAKFGLVSVFLLIGLLFSTSLAFAGTLSNLTLTTNTPAPNTMNPAYLSASWNGGKLPIQISLYFSSPYLHLGSSAAPANQSTLVETYNISYNSTTYTQTFGPINWEQASGFYHAMVSDSAGHTINSTPLYVPYRALSNWTFTLNGTRTSNYSVPVYIAEIGGYAANSNKCLNSSFAEIDGQNYTVVQLYSLLLHWQLGTKHTYSVKSGCLNSNLNYTTVSSFKNITINEQSLGVGDTQTTLYKTSGVIQMPDTAIAYIPGTNISANPEINIVINYNENGSNLVNASINEFLVNGNAFGTGCWKESPVVTIDGQSYTVNALETGGSYDLVAGESNTELILPMQFIWAPGSTHTYSFNVSYCPSASGQANIFKNITLEEWIGTPKQKTWTSPSGSITIPETINTTTERNIYLATYNSSKPTLSTIMFGIGNLDNLTCQTYPNPNSTILTVDGVPYTLQSVMNGVAFYWKDRSTHTFIFNQTLCSSSFGSASFVELNYSNDEETQVQTWQSRNGTIQTPTSPIFGVIAAIYKNNGGTGTGYHPYNTTGTTTPKGTTSKKTTSTIIPVTTTIPAVGGTTIISTSTVASTTIVQQPAPNGGGIIHGIVTFFKNLFSGI